MHVDLGQGVKIAYRITGNGPPVMMLMGFGATMDLWSEAFIKSLSKHFQVIVLDNRGTGASIGPEGPVSIKDFATDIVGLMDKLGFKKAHIFGISMGGMIAQQVAVSYPERVEKLVLGATTCASKFIRKNPALLGLFLFKIWPTFAIGTMISKEYLRQHPEAIEPIKSYAKKNPSKLKVLRLQSAAVRGYDLSEEIQHIAIPTLILVGTGDRIINPENSDIIAAKIKGSRLVKFSGVGHFFPLEKPEETTREVLGFLT